MIPDIYVDPRIPADAYRPTFVKSLVMVPIRIKAPIGAIADIARKFWILGTPGMVFGSGKLVPGAIPREQIEGLLDAEGKS